MNVLLSIFSRLNSCFIAPETSVSSEIEQPVDSVSKSSIIGVNELNIYGDSEKFLFDYLGEGWQEALVNPQVYHQLKSKIAYANYDIYVLLEEKKHLVSKLNTVSLNRSFQTTILEYFHALKFNEARQKIDHYLESNRLNSEDRKALTYQKALTYIEERDYSRAYPLFVNTLSDVNNRYVLTDYANVLCQLGQWDEAIDLYETFLEEGTYGAANRMPLYIQLAEAYFAQGNEDRALEYYQTVLERFSVALHQETLWICRAYRGMAQVYDAMNEYKQALLYHQKVLMVQYHRFGMDHPSMASSYRESAMIYHLTKEYTKAQKAMEKAVILYRRILPQENSTLRQCNAELASIDRRLCTLSY